MRVLRNRPGEDTKQTLEFKLAQMRRDVDEAKISKFINKVFVNDRLEDFLKKASVYIVF